MSVQKDALELACKFAFETIRDNLEYTLARVDEEEKERNRQADAALAFAVKVHGAALRSSAAEAAYSRNKAYDAWRETATRERQRYDAWRIAATRERQRYDAWREAHARNRSAANAKGEN